jgi:Na+/serine symporter
MVYGTPEMEPFNIQGAVASDPEPNENQPPTGISAGWSSALSYFLIAFSLVCFPTIVSPVLLTYKARNCPVPVRLKSIRTGQAIHFIVRSNRVNLHTIIDCTGFLEPW